MSSECHETATVTRIMPNNQVEVTVKRSEACGACAAKGACQALGGQTKDFSMVLDNRVDAKKGDTVRITLSEVAVMKASAVLYLLPAVSLVGFALLGHLIAPVVNMQQDLVSVLGALTGLGAGFLLAWVVSRAMSGNSQLVPVISKVIHDDSQ